MNLNDSQGFCV